MPTKTNTNNTSSTTTTTEQANVTPVTEDFKDANLKYNLSKSEFVS